MPDHPGRELSRRQLLRAGLVLPALPLVAACGGAGGPTRAGSARASSSTTGRPAVAPPPTGPRGPLGSGEPVTFAFAGDTHFVDTWDTEGGADYGGVPVLSDQLRADPAHVLAPVTSLISKADVAMVNLETAITNRGEPVSGKAYHFRSPPESFTALKAAGFDVVNMANNHALDYGPVGMDDTFSAIESSGLPVVGIGHNATEAYRPHRRVVNGQRISIFGAVDWLEPELVSQWTATDRQPGLAFSIDRTRLVAAVTEERPAADTLVVFMHWGIEQTHCASSEQEDLATALLGAGTDIIVGSHAHRVFGAGHFHDALVAYGLGNFVYFREDGESGSSGVLLVTATGRRVDSYSWVPARISHGIPVPESGAAAAADLSEWTHRRDCSGLLP